jgi:hypothetical protein
MSPAMPAVWQSIMAMWEGLVISFHLIIF